jgi:hypothetical protein
MAISGPGFWTSADRGRLPWPSYGHQAGRSDVVPSWGFQGGALGRRRDLPRSSETIRAAPCEGSGPLATRTRRLAGHEPLPLFGDLARPRIGALYSVGRLVSPGGNWREGRRNSLIKGSELLTFLYQALTGEKSVRVCLMSAFGADRLR